jgi:hypothetical protein
MRLIKDIITRKPQITEPLVIYAYCIEDTPSKTMGLKVPHAGVKTAKWALTEAHGLTDRQLSIRGYRHGVGRLELIRAIEDINKISGFRGKRAKADHYVLGPAAAHVVTGLSIGAKEIHLKTGRQVLTVETKVLTNHECVDIFRTAIKL